MPRKTSQPTKKDSAETKSEGVAPRRSGRATTATKHDFNDIKDPSRSRRSSTAAQTVASVADSKSSKGKNSVGNRRESPSPSEPRVRTGRDGVESPATRVKSARRSTGRVNYKESDGEEEAPTPKYDDNFISGEEFDDSDSDEKSRGRGRNKQAKTPTKGRGSREKAGGGSRGRRGRPSKKKNEAPKTLDISDDSMEPEVIETRPAKTVAKSNRGRKSKTEVVDVESESKAKPARRSARSTSIKDETPKKRPSRSIQAKRYTEDDEDDIEEIGESKAEAVIDKREGSRKRKRSISPEESKKRVREVEDENSEEKEMEEKQESEKNEIETMEKEEPMEEEEAMEEEEPIEEEKSKTEIKPECKEDLKDIDKKEVSDNEEVKEDTMEIEEKAEIKEKVEKESGIKSEEDIVSSESNETSNDNQSFKTEAEPVPSKTQESPEIKNNAKEVISEQKPSVEESTKKSGCISLPETPDKLNQTENTPVSKPAEVLNTGTSLEPSKIKDNEIKEPNSSSSEVSETQNDISTKNCGSTPESFALNASPKKSVSEVNVSPSIIKSDSTVNGAEKNNDFSNLPTESVMHNVNSEHNQNTIPRANGAHENVVHNDTTVAKENNTLSRRKLVLNSKLNEGVLHSIKSKTFGFLSYNLGSDACVQKDKLLKELLDFNSHIVCLQQVPKIFYSSVLEPSLDALGYKSIFSQPQDSLKGMATFFKSSQFKLNEFTEVSLKQLVDKELETSTLDATSKATVQSYVKRCGSALLTHFTSVIGTQSVIVVNVQIPPSDLSAHALQVSCLAREIIRINGGTNKPLLIGGEFNISENDASYQLLRDGYLSNDMIDELQRRKDIIVPEKEKSSLLDLLWKSFQHPSSNLCSCYVTVLNHELLIPELKKASPDLLWYSSDSLITVGVVDADSDKPTDRHFSLKADIAFSN